MLNNLKIGTAIDVKPRTRYQYLKAGAIIEPTIPHELPGYRTTVQGIYQDEMEDQDGKTIIEVIVVTARGDQVSLDEVEIIE